MEEKVLQHRYPGQNSMRDVDNRVLGYTYQPNFSILRLQMKQQPSPADEDTTKTPGSSDEKVRKCPFCYLLLCLSYKAKTNIAKLQLEDILFG